MPSITQNRMRLARMTGQQALAAVMKPGGRLVSEEVAAAIVRFTAGGSELANAEVEPSLLSLICRELNNARIAQGRSEISADLLAGSRDTILAEFYERALADQPPGVRQVDRGPPAHRIRLPREPRRGARPEGVRRRRRAAGHAGDAGRPAAAAHRGAARRAPRRAHARRAVQRGQGRAATCGSSARRATRRSASSRRSASASARRARRWSARGRSPPACAVLAVGAVGSAVFGYFSHEARAGSRSAGAVATRRSPSRRAARRRS